MKKIFFFLFVTLFMSCDNKEMISKVQSLESELTSLKTQLSEAKAKKPYTPGLVHSVFFWLKEDLSKQDEQAFLAGVNSLKKIKDVKTCYIGPPAPTEERGVVDNSFSYALLAHFDDLDGQNAYQIDPIHLKFVEDHKDKWTKVIVYDNVMSK